MRRLRVSPSGRAGTASNELRLHSVPGLRSDPSASKRRASTNASTTNGLPTRWAVSDPRSSGSTSSCPATWRPLADDSKPGTPNVRVSASHEQAGAATWRAPRVSLLRVRLRDPATHPTRSLPMCRGSTWQWCDGDRGRGGGARRDDPSIPPDADPPEPARIPEPWPPPDEADRPDPSPRPPESAGANAR